MRTLVAEVLDFIELFNQAPKTPSRCCPGCPSSRCSVMKMCSLRGSPLCTPCSSMRPPTMRTAWLSSRLRSSHSVPALPVLALTSTSGP
ncbi:hypothetical protein VULLAG_LOCUS14456 [Vulpes lagopus]